MSIINYEVGIALANQFLLRWDKSPAQCDPRYGWEKGSGGKCVRKEPEGEKIFQSFGKPFPVEGEDAAATISASGFSLGNYLKDPDGVKLAIQRQYMDMMQATGARTLVPKIAEAKAKLRDVFSRETDISRELTKVEPKEMTKLERAYVNSRKGMYQDNLYNDLAWVEKNKDKVQKLNISPTEASVIRDYARPGTYRLVNGIARQMPEVYYPPFGALAPYKKMEQQEVERIGVRTSKLLSSSLKKMPEYEGVTYRGLTLPDEAIQQLIKNGKWQENGFMSSTKDLSLAYPGNVVYRIYSNKGKDISSIEPIPNKEVLFPKKSIMKLKRYRKINKLGKEFYVMDFVV